MTAASAVEVAVTFTWLGMVLGISFLEAPLKFRAPGVTSEIGVGIGRLVFRAMHLAEGVLAIVIAVALVLRAADVAVAEWVLFALIVVVLLLGAAVLRPIMDRAVVAGRLSSGVPRTVIHSAFVVFEIAKVALLVAFGVVALAG